MTEKPVGGMLPNPNYGHGCFRRYIALRRQNNATIAAALEDDVHAFTLQLKHDGKFITDISLQWSRYPITACGETSDQIKQMIGIPLSPDPFALQKNIDVSGQCTHAVGLASLALAQIFRVEKEWLYQAEVFDADSAGKSTARLSRNRVPCMEWVVQNNIILEPAPFTSRSTMGGFSSWAAQNFVDDDLEAALVLQRALLVSGSRHVDLNKLIGQEPQYLMSRENGCHVARQEIIARSECLASQKDFSIVEPQPELMLDKFAPDQG